MNKNLQILYIDDNPMDRALVRDSLEQEHGGFDLTEAESQEEFEKLIEEKNFDIVLSDFNILGYEGLQVLDYVKENHPHIPVIMVTGTGSETVAVESMRRGAADYVIKTTQHIQKLPQTILSVIDKKKVQHERDKVLKDLKESEERFIHAMNASNDGLFDWNLETNDIYYSPGWKKMLGYEDHELPNDFSVWENTTDPKDVKKSWELQQKLISKQIDRFVIEFKMKHKDGHWIDILSRAKAIFDDKGKAIRMVGTHTDITDRKKADEALIINQYYLEKAQEIGSVGTWELDLIKNELIWTDQNYHNFSIPVGTPLTYEIFLDCVFPEDRDFVNNEWNNAINGQPYDIEHRILVDGQVKWLREKANITFDKKGKAIKAIGFTQDITERKEAEEALKQSEASLRDAQRIASIGNWSLDLTTGQVHMSDEMFNLIGLDKSEGPDVSQHEKYYTPESWQRFQAAIKEAQETGKSYEIEMEFARKDAKFRIAIASVEPVYDENNKMIGLKGILQDITKEKQYEANLIEAKEKAEKSDRLKSAFLANMSHEIRTPMNGILGFAGLLKKPELSGEQQQNYIQIIEKSGERMLNIINDIVSISKIESGIIEVYLTETNINKQLQFIYKTFKLEADNKKLNLSFTCGLSEKEAVIKTDSEKFYGILTNLVKNAIKYTDTGTIEFGYTYNENELEFYVKDTGIGIPKEKQEAIFERFIQADIADIQARQGAGLGLAISRAYTEMLGGEIWVESEEGKGSTFFFTIPNMTDTESKINKTIPSENKKESVIPEDLALKVLIAEDDEASEMLMSIELTKFSKEILKATNGIDAIEACRMNPDIDLVLMDIQMPKMNGYQATREIRKFNKNVVIIAQTAFALTGDREKAIESGCNNHISKPIKQDELLTLIQSYFKK
ncbi:MAG: response regulator [Bacteroidetes bacterium]|nr:response regulator [Bacteroidota bacterium]